jgi:hypothetical protein
MGTKCSQQGISEHGACRFELIFTAVAFTCHQNTVCHEKKASSSFPPLLFDVCSKRTLWYVALSLMTEFGFKFQINLSGGHLS